MIETRSADCMGTAMKASTTKFLQDLVMTVVCVSVQSY